MALPDPYAYLLIMCALPSGEYSVNKAWYQTTATITAAEGDIEAAALASAATTNFASAYNSVLSVEATFTGIEAYVVTGAGTFAHLVLTNAAGSVTGDQLPNYAAVLINKRAARPGRRGLGRCYIPGVPKASVDDNYVNSGAGLGYGSLAATFANDLVTTGATWEACLYSPTDALLTPLVSTSYVTELASIRSRKPR